MLLLRIDPNHYQRSSPRRCAVGHRTESSLRDIVISSIDPEVCELLHTCDIENDFVLPVGQFSSALDRTGPGQWRLSCRGVAARSNPAGADGWFQVESVWPWNVTPREFDRLGDDLKPIERDLAGSALADERVKRAMTISRTIRW